MGKKQKIIFDTETTGLNPEQDDILQLSAINEKGEVLIDTYIKPIKKGTWKEAEAINHISPDMVKNCKTISELKDEIEKIFSTATELIAYNAEFDLSFLAKAGIKIPEVPVSDPMIDFAEIYGEWSEYLGCYKWQKLITAARYYGYDFENGAHNSLADVRATLCVYNAIKKKRTPFLWRIWQVRDQEGNVVLEANNIEEVCDKAREIDAKHWSEFIHPKQKESLKFEDFLDVKKSKDERGR